ncbi:MAG: hypothetical protein II220_03435, partial [Spirochaetales bacterium]|nr:hypothetical protein [Spirochaetales bacterium]
MYFENRFLMRLIKIGLFCSLIFVAGCRNKSENLYLPYEKILDSEPNNSFESALPQKVTASLNIAGFYNEYEKNQSPDFDYYHISLAKSGCAYRMTLT